MGTSVGFTGTRKGMTAAQRDAARALLRELAPSLATHGDCVGADADFHDVVRELFSSEGCRVVIRPGPDGEFRAHKAGDKVLPEKNFFARNRDIVNTSDVLIVCPLEFERQLRGGTWMTYDYAVKQGCPVRIVWPDGMVTEGQKREPPAA